MSSIQTERVVVFASGSLGAN